MSSHKSWLLNKLQEDTGVYTNSLIRFIPILEQQNVLEFI
jgi:hypothetical protein